MRFFTCCNYINDPRLSLLKKSAERFGINVEVLGQGIKWTRNYLKITLLLDAIKDLPPDEIVLCTDALDVIYLADEATILERFSKFHQDSIENTPVVFSGERLYSHHFPKYRKYWDKVAETHYKYVNSGTFIGYQSAVKEMLEDIVERSKDYTGRSDQKLFGKYGATHQGKLVLDYHGELFWCPAGEQQFMDKLYHIRDGKLYVDKLDSEPCFVHVTALQKYRGNLIRIAKLVGVIDKSEVVQKLKRKTKLTKPKKWH